MESDGQNASVLGFRARPQLVDSGAARVGAVDGLSCLQQRPYLSLWLHAGSWPEDSMTPRISLLVNEEQLTCCSLPSLGIPCVTYTVCLVRKPLSSTPALGLTGAFSAEGIGAEHAHSHASSEARSPRLVSYKRPSSDTFKKRIQ